LGEVTRDEAERQLGFVLADVARGAWKPAERIEVPVEVEMSTFHQFAEEWWVLHEGVLAPRTRTDYRWRLEKHLLGFFGEMPLDTITFDNVERYIASKLGQEHPLAPRSINMTVTLLAAILESAFERDLIQRNPAKGRGRRVRERAPARSYLETGSWRP